MKNTVKLFGLIALIALIGFAACDDGNNPDNIDPDKPGGDITWTASANGTADTESSTIITLTFSAAITGLTADNITLTDGTGSAAKVSLLGSGAGYILNITVTTAGTVSINVTKDGVNADAQDVTVHKKPGIITWSAAANGAESTADSTKITFTFSEAITGLTADDITLNTITVSVTKGELSGSGTSWELGITFNKQGYITAAITKNNVSADAQQVQVFKAAVNPTSAGRITYINDGEQVVFSGGGTYTLKSQRTIGNARIWQPKAEGIYTWNQTAQTLTLTVDKVADDDGVMTPEADAMLLFVAWIEEEIENEITARLAWSANILGEDRENAEAAVLAIHNDENETSFITLDDLINYLAEIRSDETFIIRTYTYTLSNDSASLILLDALPEPVGTDELAGQTYNGTTSNFLGVSSKNPNHIYIFSAAGRTYIETSLDGVEGGITTSTGYYSYNSSTKRIYLQPATRNGKTPEQYYDTADYYPEFDRYPSEADSRTSQTHQYFRLWRYEYDPATNIIDTRDSGDIEPL